MSSLNLTVRRSIDTARAVKINYGNRSVGTAGDEKIKIRGIVTAGNDKINIDIRRSVGTAGDVITNIDNKVCRHSWTCYHQHGQ